MCLWHISLDSRKLCSFGDMCSCLHLSRWRGLHYHLLASGNFLPKLQNNGMSYWRCGCSFCGFLNKQLCNWKSWALLALGLKIPQAEHFLEICPPLRQWTQRGSIEVERWNLEEVQEKIMLEEAGAKAFKNPHRHQVPHSKKQQRETEMAVGKLCMHPCAGHRGRLYSTLYWYCKRGKKDLQFWRQTRMCIHSMRLFMEQQSKKEDKDTHAERKHFHEKHH